MYAPRRRGTATARPGAPRRASPHGADARTRPLWRLPRSRASGYPSNDKIAEANRQINEVKGIMQENIEKAIRREDNLQHLNDKTGKLGEVAQGKGAAGRGRPPTHGGAAPTVRRATGRQRSWRRVRTSSSAMRRR